MKSLAITALLLLSVGAMAQNNPEKTFRQPYPLGEKLSSTPNFTGDVWLAPLSEQKELHVSSRTLINRRDEGLNELATMYQYMEQVTQSSKKTPEQNG